MSTRKLRAELDHYDDVMRDKISEACADADGQIADLQAELATAKGVASESVLTIGRLQNEVDELKKELATSKQEGHTMWNGLNESIAELQAELATAKNEYAELSVGFEAESLLSDAIIIKAKNKIAALKEQVGCKHFQDLIGKWANDTFGVGIQTHLGVMSHFIKEVIEFEKSHDPEEAADCFLLLLQHAHECGYDLFEEAQKKHEINTKRKWGKPDESGCIEHIRDNDKPITLPKKANDVMEQVDQIAKLKKRNATLIHEAMVADNDLIALQGDYAHQQVELELAKETLANAIKEIGVQGRLVGTTQAELAAARKELKALKGGKDDNNK